MIDISRICACMGKLKGDPYCPCVMKQKGLDMSHHEITEEEKKRFEKFFGEVCKMEKEKQNDE